MFASSRQLSLSAGVIFVFTLFGYAQEALTKTEFGPERERFTYVGVLVIIQCISNAVVAALCLAWQRRSLTGGVPIREISVVSLGAYGANTFGLMSLRHIPFPLQVVCKSCKTIPVMIGETLFAGKTHSLEKKIQVVIMTAGVVTFTLCGKKSKGDSKLSEEVIMGIGFVILALICDGIYGPYQNKLSKQYAPSSFNLMFNLNAGETLIAIAISVLDGSLFHAIPFILRHFATMGPLLFQFSLCVCIGNIFLFQLQSDFGALSVTITTTVRKMVSVIVSVFLFGHHLMLWQWLAAALVFTSSELAGRLSGLIRRIRAPKEA